MARLSEISYIKDLQEKLFYIFNILISESYFRCFELEYFKTERF